MRITTGGNVGIGTTSPVYKLDVFSSIFYLFLGPQESDRSPYSGLHGDVFLSWDSKLGSLVSMGVFFILFYVNKLKEKETKQ